MNIKNLKERGESFYQNRMDSVVKYLAEKNFLEEDEGRKIMFGDGQPVITLNYITSMSDVVIQK